MKQNGNVLFLILIAVALFAALSYAVTKSTSGGGDASRETVKLKFSEVLQHVSLMKFSLMRMKMNGAAHEDLLFGYDRVSSKITGISDATAQAQWDGIFGAFTVTPLNQVFHVDGGDAPFGYPPASLCADNLCSTGGTTHGSYYYLEPLKGLRIEDVGTTAADAVMFIINVDPAVCNAINNELGIGTGNYPTDSDGDNTFSLFPGERMGCGNLDGIIAFYVVLLEG